MILYHNTSNANALKINKEGIIAGLEVDKYGKDSEAEGAGIWCTTIRGYGYGGATITFEIDDSDSKLVKQNDTEYILYHNVPVDNIIDIDLVIAYDLPSNIDRTDSINTTVESDITNALNYYGKDILLKVFGQNKNHFVEPYNYDTFENLLNTGKKYCKGTIDINTKSVNEGLILNLSNFQILTEARIQQLRDKTRSQTPKLADRADFLKTDYIGISKFGIFNFRTTSQTNPGKYWYQTIEIPNLAEKLLDEDITPELIRSLLEQDDIKLYCDCLTGDTKILMSDNTEKAIKDIQEGDKVITHTGAIKTVRGKSNRPAYDDLLELDLGDRKIKCTKNHQFLVDNNGKQEWIKAKDLTTDMSLLELGDLK